MKILGIDDNPDIIKYVSLTVTGMGHEFTSANNGKDGLKMIQDNQYDLVLLDLSMPEFSGLDVINQLIEDGIIKNQRIVIFTASSSADNDFDDLIRKGVHSYLEKPIDIDVLMAKITEFDS